MNNNKLIAEFMGAGPDKKTFFRTGKKVYFYDTSWDWLMPVANEIIKSRDEQNADWDLTELKYALCTTNIELVYDAVVEFIKEHNKYICGSCGDHVNEVVFNEDADVDECTNCTEYYDR